MLGNAVHLFHCNKYFINPEYLSYHVPCKKIIFLSQSNGDITNCELTSWSSYVGKGNELISSSLLIGLFFMVNNTSETFGFSSFSEIHRSNFPMRGHFECFKNSDGEGDKNSVAEMGKTSG